MTFESALALWRRHLRTLVVGAVLGLLVAGVAAALAPHRYTAEAAVYVSGLDTVPSPGADPFTTIKLVDQRVTSLRELMVSDRVLGPVAQRTGTPIVPGSVVVTAGKASSVFAVTAVTDDPARAATTAVAAADRFVEVLSEVEPGGASSTPAAGPPVVALAPARALVVGRPTVGTPTGLGLSSMLLVGGVAGVLAAAAFVLLRGVRDAARRPGPGEDAQVPAAVGGTATGVGTSR